VIKHGGYPQSGDAPVIDVSVPTGAIADHR
jgi:hypothetical protein